MSISVNKNQSGIVSFFVVIIIMLVLTLIVLAFSQLVRREQRQTLDRQLQTQALYAAESGINDARDWLENEFDGTQTWNSQCSGPGSFLEVASLDPQLDGANGVTSYSCLFVDPTPDTLTYEFDPEESAALQLNPDGQPLNRMRVRWGNPEGSSFSCGGAVDQFPPNGNQPNCDIATLRIEIIPFNGNKNRNQLINERMIIYATPGNPTGTVVWGNNTGRQQGRPVGSSCSGSGSGRECVITINNIPDITHGYMRLTTIYDRAKVTLEPLRGNTPLSMIGAQYEIDTTGRSNDVLHRIRANVPIVRPGSGPAPEFVIQSRRSLCKRFNVVPSSPPSVTVDSGFNISGGFCSPIAQ